MATANLDEIAQLQALYGRALSPIDRLGAGQVALATNDLEQRQQLAEQARRQLFASQLQQQQQAFTINRDEARRREIAALQEDQQKFTLDRDTLQEKKQLALLDKGEALQILREGRQRKAHVEDLAIGAVFQSAADEDRFERQLQQTEKLFEQGQRGKDLDEKRQRLKDARAYGIDLPDTATPFEIEQGIQQAASESLGATLSQLKQVGASVAQDSGKDEQEVQADLKRALVKTDTFRSLIRKLSNENQARIRLGLHDGTLPLTQIPAILDTEEAGFLKSNKSKRELLKNEFSQAITEAGIILADREIQNPNARLRPDYLQKLSTLKILQEKASADIKNLRNPLKVKEALEAMQNSVRPLPKTLPSGGPPLPPDGRGASGSW